MSGYSGQESSSARAGEILIRVDLDVLRSYCCVAYRCGRISARWRSGPGSFSANFNGCVVDNGEVTFPLGLRKRGTIDACQPFTCASLTFVARTLSFGGERLKQRPRRKRFVRLKLYEQLLCFGSQVSTNATGPSRSPPISMKLQRLKPSTPAFASRMTNSLAARIGSTFRTQIGGSDGKDPLSRWSRNSDMNRGCPGHGRSRRMEMSRACFSRYPGFCIDLML